MKKDKQLLLKYLQSHNFVTLATHDKHLWTSSVYYVMDNYFNLYFLSEPTTMHCRHIAKNSEIACAIADSSQKVTDKKVGVQLYGRAVRVNSINKIKWMLKLWNKLNPGFESIINLKNIQTNKINGRIYKVTPKLIKFFNEKLYGPEGFELFKF